MRSLSIAKGFSLPLSAVTQKIAWLGQTGSGKTYGCKRFVEQMLRIRAQVVVLDGSGAWAGLRLGKQAFKIPVLGGLYGDIPLEPTAGALIADVIVDSRTSMVLDVSQMLDSERTRFAAAFAERFFFRKKASPSAVHLVLEECQDFVPENEQPGEQKMLHEFQRLAKQGRMHGIGVSFISQRPQEIAKKALNQAECVFAFHMGGPQERKAIQYWLSDKGFESDLAKVLPHLEVGSPHVWAPQLKVSKVVHILPISSLDTSRTPQVGDKKSKQKKLKRIDLKGLEKAMAETIERSKAEDPKELRKRIVELEKELKKKVPSSAVASKGTGLREGEIAVRRDHLEHIVERVTTFEKELDEYAKSAMTMEKATRHILIAANSTSGIVRRACSTGSDVPGKRLAKAPTSTRVPDGEFRVTRKQIEDHNEAMEVLRKKSNGVHTNGAGTTIGGGLRRMMVALAQCPDGLTNSQLAVRAGMAQSGTFSTYLSRGRTEGWIVYEGQKRKITDEGLAALGLWNPLPEGHELLEYWLQELGGGGITRMLSALAEVYPRALTDDELAAAAGMERSGTYSTYLSKLRTLELVEGRGEIKLSEELSG